MDISYILMIIFMMLFLIFGIVGVYYPNKIIKYYLKYTKQDPRVLQVMNKSWFYPSFKISSFLLILYLIVIIVLLLRRIIL
ncbi:uncharacterized protein YneF (UPF0154 family) [Chryseobacterium sp. PvR013]|nr:uncharacterized protein YneF (UPF0154 family) [Chryseobacterium sp. PvR013]